MTKTTEISDKWPKNMLEAHAMILDWLQWTEHGKTFDEDMAEVTLKFMSWQREELRKERAWSKVAREALDFASGDRFDAATDGEDMRPTPIAVLALDALKKREEIFNEQD